jgi:hypothetical protein
MMSPEDELRELREAKRLLLMERNQLAREVTDLKAEITQLKLRVCSSTGEICERTSTPPQCGYQLSALPGMENAFPCLRPMGHDGKHNFRTANPSDDGEIGNE